MGGTRLGLASANDPVRRGGDLKQCAYQREPDRRDLLSAKICKLLLDGSLELREEATRRRHPRRRSKACTVIHHRGSRMQSQMRLHCTMQAVWQRIPRASNTHASRTLPPVNPGIWRSP
jgi:hypothetical protein